MRRTWLALVALALVPACGSGGRGTGAAPDTVLGAGAGTDTLLAVNGTHLWVHREGAGDPILVIHGGPVLDHGYLVSPLRSFAADHELVFYDQRLSGRSDGTVDSSSLTLENFVEDIEALRKGLGLVKIDLLAHSWGGLLAMEYALEHPSSLRSLVLVSPMPPSSALWGAEQRVAAAALEPEDTAGMGALRASAAYRAGDPRAIERMLQLSFRSELADPAVADSLHFHIEPDYRERSRQFGLLIPDLSTYDLTSRLPELRVPTLVVFGAEETGARSEADTLRALLPRAQVEVIPGAGHFSFLERPQAFRGIVRRFLRDGPLADPR
ncbi:MAG: alpha/beta fold hydrolase [Candidatus Palauibacterales bacterium]|nr:alpha/beta fold hydrolase [Candidatus Palauibacterales bacterium]MDP2529790.1 alpha/beta fold hydrolase [Candidatus Palauibacterales bacterium]MDP2582682.1 alpha/beta fold hydrolase [Candidatus Palauibacterales bacterium]